MEEPVFNIPDTITQPLSQIFAPINMIMLIGISIYHVISVKSNIKNKLKYPASLNLSFLLILFGILTLMGILFHVFGRFESDVFCKITQLLGVISYVVFKTILYLLFLFRLYECFGTARIPIKYKTVTLLCWSATLMTWNMLNIVLIGVTTNIYFDRNTMFCVVAFQKYTLISLGTVDLIACAVNLYLFTRPIWKLHKLNKNMQKNNSFIGDESRDLKHIAIKQCILSIIATITTLFGVIFIALIDMSAVFGSTDITVSFVCIIMMYKWNSFIVEKLCCCLRKSGKSSDAKTGLEMNVSN
eukprot:459442_1